MPQAHSRRILWPLAAATLLPIGVLAWLGLRVLDQELGLERERQRQDLHVAGLRAAVDIERYLQVVEAGLARGEGLVFTSAGIAAVGAEPLIYQPLTPVSASLFPGLSGAERAEYQARDLTSAVAAYARAARSSNPELKAAALLGLGRVLRKSGRPQRALEAFAELEELGSVAVADQPAALVARQARLRLFDERGDDRLRQEARALAGALFRGGWAIDRATFEVYWTLATKHAASVALPQEKTARAEAAVRLWHAWRAGDWPPGGRRILSGEAGAALALWQGIPERPLVSVISFNRLHEDLQPSFAQHAILVAATDANGRPLFGTAGAGGIPLLPGETRLPFVLDVAPEHADGIPARQRRGVFITGLSLAFVLMATAAYSLYRTTTRELRLAEQQRDFVSAVSHEFRTPLTSLRHLVDLLVTRKVASEERRSHYYRLLAHETNRLHRMVENLLSFGRIEASAYAWRIEPLDVADLVGSVAGEFGQEAADGNRELHAQIDDDLPAIRGDAEALSRAVWNLLENAAKYSDRGAPIRLFARRQGTSVLIGVGDRGIGIPIDEQQRIFQTFARGRRAADARIRGVGIGLALVKRIVEAHGGSVTVESEPGQGSTFTLVIPCSES